MLNTKSIKSFTDLRLDPAALSKQASEEGPVYILNRNKPVSVLVDVHEFEGMLEELQDVRDSLWLRDNEDVLVKAKGMSAEELKKKYNI